MQTFYGTLAVVVAFFALMSVRLLFIKGGEFKGTCASQSPFLVEEGATCGFCGKEVGTCENDTDKEETSEVNKVLNKF